MKLFAKLFAVASAAVISLSAFAEGGTKTAVLDTGKGGTRLIVSVPDFAEGPYDFGKNPGVGKSADEVWNHQEVMFNAAIGESGVVVYQAELDRVYPAKTSKRFTLESVANGAIKAAGFEGRAEQINCPPAPIEGATTVCFRMSGDAIFDGKPMREKLARVLAVILFADGTQSYTLMATAVEKNPSKFLANSEETIRLSKGAFVVIWKGHRADLN